jgi:hypothetical protein
LYCYEHSLIDNRSNVWVNLSDEILESFFDGEFLSCSDIETLPFVFDSGSDNLADFHPSTVQIFRLWQTFVENVNPITKIIHVPTVQRELLEASVNLQEVAKPFEALMFAIYASAITSLSNEECGKLTNIPKQQLRKRYHIVAQQALTRAGVFGTMDIVVLQAALLLLVCHCVLYQVRIFFPTKIASDSFLRSLFVPSTAQENPGYVLASCYALENGLACIVNRTRPIYQF